MSALLLRLEGPFQSWGSEAGWNIRSTDLLPTKSGIIGMISCALGISRYSEKAFEIAGRFRLGIRADRPGTLLTDFQTVTGAPLMTASRKPRGSNTIVTYRSYLVDASMLAVLEADDDSMLKEWANALRCPVWPLALGRRCCAPAVPVVIGIDRSERPLDEILRAQKRAERAKYPMLCELEGVSPEASHVLTRRDVPLGGNPPRFAERLVSRFAIRPNSATEGGVSDVSGQD